MTNLDARAAGAKRLKDQVCIVTGGGQGIGKATAFRFAEEGGVVVVAERNERTCHETADAISAAGARALAVPSDVSSLADAERLMRVAVENFGRIDVLANVVGGTIWWQPFEKYEETQIMEELQRSLFTTLWCCKAALPHMIAQKKGAIVNFGSSVTKGGIYRVPYAVSKGGVEALTRTLAAENGRHGIRVNCVSPGVTIIADRAVSRLTLRPGEVAAPMPGAEDLVAETRNARPPALRRTGTADEQAAVAAFLASEDASFVTGQNIECDGGVF